MRLIPFVAAAVAAVAVLTGGIASAAGAERGPRVSPQFDGTVYTTAYLGETVYVGGSFGNAIVGGRSVARSRLAAFDARTGALLNWAPNADDTVRALATDGHAVYVAGDFSRISGAKRDSLAKLDATSGAVDAFSHAIAGSPVTLAVQGSRLYVGGRFTQIDSSRRANLAAFDTATGALDARWTPTTDDAVESIAAGKGRVYLGGSFHKTGNVSNSLRLTAVDPVTGALDKGFQPRPEAVVHSVAVGADGTVYAGMGGQGGRAAAYAPDGRQRWLRVFDGDVQAVAALGDVAYVGGHFDRACKTARNGSQGVCTDGSLSRVKLAAVDGSGRLLDWAPQANGIVGVRTLTAAEPLRQVVAGGEFTMVAGASWKRLAVFG
ncbi:hypothetical protein ABT369_36055 [Dactylosporangium sp. NPDC000244]|uniref:hypothetical protein n=1 Tax=Dactylosporangium sp. NPDC000244 TaxID=3154365 RepID=UPI0033330094